MYGPPRVCKGFVKDGWTVCSNVSGLVIGKCGFPGPRWKSARPGPYKSCGFCEPLNLSGFRNAGRLSGHLSLFPPADV
jgi:hypothetical protein